VLAAQSEKCVYQAIRAPAFSSTGEPYIVFADVNLRFSHAVQGPYFVSERHIRPPEWLLEGFGIMASGSCPARLRRPRAPGAVGTGRAAKFPPDRDAVLGARSGLPKQANR